MAGGGKRNIFKLINCALQWVADLPFTFNEGACAASKNQVFLCFDRERGTYNQCDTAFAPVGPFTALPLTTHSHKDTRAAADDGKHTLFEI